MKDFLPCFCDVDDDWRKRWGLLRKFLKRWYSAFEFSEQSRKTYQIAAEFPSGILPVESWGTPIDEVEERLEVTLPPSLREWHSLFHQTNSHYFNLLRDDHAMLWSDDGNMLVFRVLCEGNRAWGVSKFQLDEDDPLVHELGVKSYGDSDDSWEGTEWSDGQCTGHRVSEWLIQNINWYLINRTYINVQVPEAKAARDKLMEEIAAESERHSVFGGYSIFESKNRFFAHHRDMKLADDLKIYFARDVDFDNPPAWIFDHSNDHRIVR